MAETSHPVKVYIYDISKGLARALSRSLLGKHLDGIWHTGIVVFNQEFFFGGGGIESCDPGGTELGQPNTIVELGRTEVPKDVLMEHLCELGSTSFKPECYHLIDHNCNTFSNELAQFLTGKGIPDNITNLPSEVMDTPFGAMIRPMIDSLSVNPMGGTSNFSRPSPQKSKPKGDTAAKPSGSKKPGSSPPRKGAAGSSKNNSCNADVDNTPIRCSTNPCNLPMLPITFIETMPNVTSWADVVRTTAKDSDKTVCDEIVEYLNASDPQWSIGPSHWQFLLEQLANPNLGKKTHVLTARLLPRLFQSDDCLRLINRDQHFFTLLASHESLEADVLTPLIKAVCSLFTRALGVDWVMSTKKYSLENQEYSNRATTVKCCAYSLLHHDKQLTSAAVSLANNIMLYMISADEYVELGSALLQFLSKDHEPQVTKNCIFAVVRCMEGNEEVAALASIMEYDMNKFNQIEEAKETVDWLKKRLGK